METLKNGVATYFGVTIVFNETKSYASDVIAALMLTLSVNNFIQVSGTDIFRTRFFHRKNYKCMFTIYESF